MSHIITYYLIDDSKDPSLATVHFPIPMMPSQSKVKQYQDREVDFSPLSDRAFEIFGKRPFRWQLEAAQATSTMWPGHCSRHWNWKWEDMLHTAASSQQ